MMNNTNPKPTSRTIDFWAIVGEAGTGKSSLIRALTGCGRISRTNPLSSNPRAINTRWLIEYIQGPIETYVQGTSLQEVPISGVDFYNNVMQSSSDKVIVGLRLDKVIKKKITYPIAEDYVNYFVGMGWNLQGLVMLSAPNQNSIQLSLESSLMGAFQSQATRITGSTAPNGPFIPSNSIARQVRSQQNWPLV